jgi:hypothetical protein
LLFPGSKFQLVLPELEAFDMQYGPCPALLEKVSHPLTISSLTNLQLTADPAASLKVEGQALDQWCVDAAVGRGAGRLWVLLSCPCLHSTCVCQCCLDGHRININKYFFFLI